jgi:hypothetical protein
LTTRLRSYLDNQPSEFILDNQPSEFSKFDRERETAKREEGKRVVNIEYEIVLLLRMRKQKEQKCQQLRNQIDHETARISTISHPHSINSTEREKMPKTAAMDSKIKSLEFSK